jgi:DNA-binding response OmpR family regulator
LVVLLKILMDHPGEVVEREKLFCEAWETNYTGDTRSLDVHMSWLRQAIEENPRHPKYIKTIRGVGYRLDLDTATRPIQRRHTTPVE